MYQNLQHSFENSVILVVEDDYDIGDILEKYIKNENMQVIRAMNGQQALECLGSLLRHKAVWHCAKVKPFKGSSLRY